ncbi:TonB-dependent receptor domain-containing protein [Balneola sp. MJW-20]|uniref:TonB-dependent receptor n=1 Tax=Gracilimonas aurantiaca TaxID=3234185 RepID=UPI0034654246
MSLLPFILQAQTVLTVLDNVSGLPVEYALIYTEDNRKSVITDNKGKADIGKFEGEDRIVIRSIGYRTEILSFDEIRSKNFSVNLQPTQITLDEMVVSANRWIQETREVPLKVVSIRPEKVSMQNPQTAADLLTVSGEVFVQKSQLGGGSPMIRGFATNRVLLSVDGVRMNNAIFRSGNLQNVISLDPNAIENSEIIFGPGSVIYGSDAIGGVMSFYTRKPILSSNEDLFIRGNSLLRYSTANNERTTHFDISAGFKKWGFLSSVSYAMYDDLRMGSNGPEDYLRDWYVVTDGLTDAEVRNDQPRVQNPSEFDQVNVMQKIRFRPDEEWDLNYGFHYSETSDYSRYDRLRRRREGLPRSAEWYYGPQKWMMNNLNILQDSEGGLYDKLSISLAQQYFEESRNDRDFNSLILTSRTEQVYMYSANIDMEQDLNKRHRLYFGLESIFNRISSEGINTNISTEEVSPESSRYPDGSIWNSYSAYMSYRWKLTDRINLQAGSRYTYFQVKSDFDDRFFNFPFTEANINDGALTGSLGFVFNPNESLQITTNFSTGFRAPNIDDVGKVFDSEPGAVVVPNPDLGSEYAYNLDAGFIKLFGDAIRIDFNAYYTILNNALVRRNFTLNGQDQILYEGENSQVQAIQNAATARVMGLQAGLKLELPSGFGLSTQINIQDGEEELDDGTNAPLRHAAPIFGATHLSYSKFRFDADLFVEYNGEISNNDLAPSEQGKDFIYALDDNGNPYAPSWYTLNFNSMYRLTDDLLISFGVHNITDQRYLPYSSGIAAPGRNFFIALRANI